MGSAPSPGEFLLAITALGLAAILPALAFVMLIGRRDANSRLWYGAMLLYAPAVLAFMMEFRANSAVATIQVATLMLLGEALRREFSKSPGYWRTMGVAILLFWMAYQWLDKAFPPGYAWEAVLQMATLSALQFGLVGLIVRVRREIPSRGLGIVAGTLLVTASLNAARAYLAATSGRMPAMNDFVPLTNVAYVVWILTLVCLNFGYGGFVLEKSRRAQLRDAEEAARAQARQQAAESHAEELRELVRQRDQMLLVSSRFSALSSLSLYNSSIVHELSQPLQALRSALETMDLPSPPGKGDATPQREGPADAASQRARSALGLVDRMSTLLASLRQIIVAHRPTLEAVDPRALIDETLPVLQSEARARGITLRARHGLPAGVQVRAGRVLMQRVLFNLVSNAFEALAPNSADSAVSARSATASPGRSSAESPATSRQLAIELATWEALREGVPHAVVQVSDNGPGLPADLLARQFEPFNTQRAGGTGLGLALARMALESWDGHLEARNRAAEEGSGAILELWLPLSQEAEAGRSTSR